MIPTPRPRPTHVLTPEEIEALTENEIRAGVMYAGKVMGSYLYFIQDEIDRCLGDRKGIHAFFDFDRDGKPLYIYYRREDAALNLRRTT